MNRTAKRALGLRLLTIAMALGAVAFGSAQAQAQADPQGNANGCIRSAGPTGPGGTMLPAANCGVNFTLFVPERCTTESCGLIVDLPGVTLNAAVTDRQTQLSTKGTAAGFIVAEATARPSLLGLPAFAGGDERRVIQFIEEAIRELKVNPDRVFLEGFSQGAGVSLTILCQRPDLIAGASVIAPAGGGTAGCFDRGLPGRVQALMITQSSVDQLVPAERTQQTANRIITGMGLRQADGQMISQGANGAVIRRFMAPQGGKVFQFFTHNDGGATVGNGHCFHGSFEGPQPRANAGNGNAVGSVLQLIGQLGRNGEDATDIVSTLQFACNDPDDLRIGNLNIDFFMMNPRRP